METNVLLFVCFVIGFVCFFQLYFSFSPLFMHCCILFSPLPVDAVCVCVFTLSGGRVGCLRWAL